VISSATLTEQVVDSFSLGKPERKKVPTYATGHLKHPEASIDFGAFVASCGYMKKKRRIRSTYPETKAEEFPIREAAASYGVACDVVSVREAKDRLSSLLDRAARGEQIVITSDGRPKAMIVRYRPMVQGAKWTSQRSLRENTSISEDSTPIIRAMRDASY